jgi:hypothetical protein
MISRLSSFAGVSLYAECRISVFFRRSFLLAGWRENGYISRTSIVFERAAMTIKVTPPVSTPQSPRRTGRQFNQAILSAASAEYLERDSIG